VWLHDKIGRKENKGVSHCGLAIYSDLEAKEELWKLKYFTMQKYNLHKRSKNPSRYYNCN
jgi:hypothetical protein